MHTLTDSVARDDSKGAHWSAERDEEAEKYSRAAALLLAARERVLSLSEQRVSLIHSSRASALNGRTSRLSSL